MEYKDLELLATDVRVVKEANTKRITFVVRVPRSPAGERIEGIPCEYDARQLAEKLGDWEHRPLNWPDVIQLGTWLGNVLLPQPVSDLLVRSLDLVTQAKEGLRIRLLLEGALHNVPWEYTLLNRGGGEATQADVLGLTPNVSIVRHQAASLPAWEIEAQLPARMVVALASPEGYTHLDLEQERHDIEQALKDNQFIEAAFATAATQNTLLANQQRAHLFHFAGHGDFEKRMGAEPGTVEGEGLIILDDGYGDPAPFSAGQLALRLRQAGVRVAMLGACRSGRRDDVNVWSSVATALLKAGLGAVVGMQYTIQDESAIAFAGTFYQTLCSGLPIDEAVTNGRLAVAQTDVRGWGVPALYLRAPDGVVFPEYAADSRLGELRDQLRVTARQRIGELRGKAVVVDIGKMSEGVVEARQQIDTVTPGAEACAVKIKDLGGGAVKAKQNVDRVDEGGSVTGVSIDKLG